MKEKKSITDKIYTGFGEFEPVLRTWRNGQEKIVFTNGCFDLIHRGHAEYLFLSSGKGDKLVVGLNTDRSVTLLKGRGRPLMDEYSRAWILASFEFVSAVILFDDETPLRLIESVSPDILVKGDDYIPREMVGYEWVISHGGRVETIPLIPGWSTTSLLQKIRNLPL
jgi:rfaE bifunctional protein nucleotidyltransferase chain/domain